MWSKTTEGKESSQAPQIPVPEPVSPKVTSQRTMNAPSVLSPLAATNVPASASAISTGLKIHGEVTGSADLYIDGEVQGSVRMGQSKVTVGPRGQVQADIEAREIVIEGTVQGNLKASESVRLGSASHVQGSLMTPRVAIDDGARLRGRVETTRASEARRGGSAGQAKSAETPAAAGVAAKE
ncbi:MAG: bactofilin family protein [Candidatus Acidiferrales bacterium]